MAKRGRPAKVKTDELTMSQLALNQVDAANRFAKTDMAINALVRSIDDFVNTANKINGELGKRIQALEARLGDIEKKVTLPELEEASEPKDSEC